MSDGKKEKGDDPNTLNVVQREDQDAAEALAHASLRPSFHATLTLREYGKSFGELSLQGMIDSLQEQMKATKKGDLGRGEAMLTAQAHTLDSIFNNLARRAINAEYMQSLDTYLKLALRAQSQCRSTWEAISAIQNPPVAGYVGQANIAHGPQQVNNPQGKTPGASRTDENENPQNELLEKQDVEWLDHGTPGAPGEADPQVETLGTIDGAANA